jgi:hypothetical protein
MRLVAVLALLLSSTAFADVTIMDNDKELTVDCAKDPQVSLLGNHITLTLTGTCAKVTATGNHLTIKGSAESVLVPGNHNTLDLDNVDAIKVPGNHNTIMYKGPIKAKQTAVSTLGKNNTVTKK